jgi:hypothetical protein
MIAAKYRSQLVQSTAVGIRVAAALEVGQVVGGPRNAVPIRVLEPRLLTVGTRQPAEEMVEGAVLHHADDHVVDARLLRPRERTRRGRGAGSI